MTALPRWRLRDVPLSEGRHETFAQPADDLVGKGDEVPALRLDVIERPYAIERVAAGEGGNEAVDRRLVGQAEQVAHGIDIDRIGAAREHLVEHRLGVAHAAGGPVRYQLQGIVGDGAALGLDDAAQLGQDLRLGQRLEGVALQARDDGRANLGWVGRAEDEEDVVGRLLERLEQHVPAFLDALDLVDDEDLAGEVGRRGVDARQQVAHVVDPVVRGGIELDHVERAAVADGDAGLARVVGLAVDWIKAVDRLGDDARHRRLARAARTDEEQAVADPAQAGGVAQRFDDRLLADDLAEGLRTPAPIDGLVRSGRSRDSQCHAGQFRATNPPDGRRRARLAAGPFPSARSRHAVRARSGRRPSTLPPKTPGSVRAGTSPQGGWQR